MLLVVQIASVSAMFLVQYMRSKKFEPGVETGNIPGGFGLLCNI